MPDRCYLAKSLPGQAARGSGALTAFVDIMLELHPFATTMPTDRRRMLLGYSRNEETPPALMIELDAEGTAYHVLPDEPSSDFPDYWPILRIVLEDAGEPLTRARIRDSWAEGCPRPSIRTLWDWLDSACTQKLVARSGTGHTNDPFRYRLPSNMATWLANPLWRLIHRVPEPEENGPAPPADLPIAADDDPQADPPSSELAHAPADPPSTNVASDAPLAPAGGEAPDMRDPPREPAPAARSNPLGSEAQPLAPVKEPKFPAHCSWLASYFPTTDD